MWMSHVDILLLLFGIAFAICAIATTACFISEGQPVAVWIWPIIAVIWCANSLINQ